HQVMEWQGRLRFNWDSVVELFPAGMVKSMFEVYCQYIERLVDDEQSWQQNSLNHLLPKADAQLVESINGTNNDEPLMALHQSFINRAQTQPDALAVFDDGQQISYGQLYGYSQVIGAQLRQQGIKANDIVGVYIGKSWQQIAAVMGILVAGGAYLPMDVSQPQDRLNFIIEDSQMKGLVSSDAFVDGISDNGLKLAQGSLSVISVDQFTEQTLTEAAAKAPMDSVQTLQDMAYVLYTSGSTGKPKGVMLPHQGPANTVADMNRIFDMQPSDRVIGLSALHFDLSVFDVFGTLSSGAALVMVPDGAQLAPDIWHQLVVEQQITVWNSVPALMQIYVDYISEKASEHDAVQPHPLSRVVMSGDWIPPELPARMFELWPGIKVLGSGGPTETSIWDASHWIRPEDTAKDSIPYGYPMANHRIHILNSQLKNCPVGVAGEMYVGGLGLALGYLNDPEKTAELFITHPETGEALYKSGDLALHSGIESDGIEILGRSDFQVKINGYRIELGEIENAIRANSEFKEVVVVAQANDKNSGKGKKRLVAYLVDDSEKLLDDQADDQVLTAANDEELHAKLVEFKLSNPGIRKTKNNETSLLLPTPPKDPQAYKVRKSYREYLGESLDLAQFSQTLSCLSEYRADNLPMPKYRYASAGSLHPVQVFMYIKPQSIAGLEGGFYYYHPQDHKLVRLAEQSELTKASWGNGENPFIYERAAFSLFLVAEYQAIGPVYGEEDANAMMYLEAGYMSQLLMEVAPQQQVGLCPIGYIDKDVEQMMGLGQSQSILHCIVGGSITDQQIESWSNVVNHADASANTLKSKQDELATALSSVLPSYMLPASYVVVDKLPLTPNGKVDRKALVSQHVDVVVERNKVAPKNEMEKTLLAIWSQALGFDDFGTQDSFFEIGGDSVSILKVHQQLSKQLPVKLTVVDLFKYPKIAELAGFLSAATVDDKPVEDHKSKAQKQKAALGRQRKMAKGRAKA
ncbi:MAG: amino acid adenylation domain-containing protein, partial [Algicola sp.]|nr:amino acid adenylation domain-containing protein [Algicola sp.]